MRQIKKVFYGMGRLGSTALLSIISLATFYIYLSHYNLDPVLDGWANGISKIVIAFGAYFIGYFSDQISGGRSGRRRPFIISGSIGLAVSFAFLYLPEFFIPMTDQIIIFIYEAFWLSLFNFFYGFLLTPYQAWMQEITKPQERIEVSGYENGFNLIGNIIGIAGTFTLPAIIQQGGNILFEMVVILAIVEIILYMPAYLTIREPERPIPQRDIIQETKQAVKNKNYITWLIAQGVLSVGLSILITIILTYVSDFLGFTFMNLLVFAVILLVVVLVFFGVWTVTGTAKGIKTTMTIALSILSITLFMTLIINNPSFSLPIPVDIQGYIFIALASIGISGYWLFPYAIMAHIIEVDEIESGENRAGMYTGFNSIPLNIFQAFAMVLTGYIVKLPNNFGMYIWGPIAAIFIIIGLIIFRFVETDPDFEELRRRYDREEIEIPD